MHLITADEIYIPENRQRRDFDVSKLTELQKSITERGLINPITLRSPRDLALVAGERRLRAIRGLYDFGFPIKHNGSEIPVGQIPVVYMGDLDPIELEEVELAENAIRVDLTWQEHAAATARLADLRKRQAHAAGLDVPTVKDIADELLGRSSVGGEQTAVRDSIILANHLKDPEVAKAKTKSEAMKIVKKKATQEQRANNADLFRARKSEHTLINGDSVEVLKTFPPAVFDILMCDPPYGIGMDSVTSWDGSKHEYDDSLAGFETLMENILPEISRVLKHSCHAYMFCDIKNWEYLVGLVKVYIPDARVWPRPLIWYKGNIGAFPKPEEGPRYCYEAILYFTRGEKKTTGLYQDVIPINQSTQHEHPAGKPVALIYDLLRRSCEPGDRILDPFCGSGPIFPAAKKANGIATGIEMSEKYHLLALERLANQSEDLP